MSISALVIEGKFISLNLTSEMNSIVADCTALCKLSWRDIMPSYDVILMNNAYQPGVIYKKVNV